MTEKIKVVLYGVGVIGSAIARCLLEKKGLEIVGAVDIAENKIGKDLGEVLGINRKLGVTISKNVDELLSKVDAKIVVHATSSFVKDIYPQVASVVKHGVNLISTCEELSFPYYTEPDLAEQLDKLAKQHGVSILGTGINPGFLMDALVIALTGVCQRIDKIKSERVINAATRRLPFQKKIGAGLTLDEFNYKIKSKQITGHVGLEQSIAMIADALAWSLDEIVVESVEPVIAKDPVKSEYIEVDAGQAAGLKQIARGMVDNKDVIVLDFQAYIGAKCEFDAIKIVGTPNVNQKIEPCVHGDISTISMVVNGIPKVINAPPGLFTMNQLPIPSAALEDFRKYVTK